MTGHGEFTDIKSNPDNVIPLHIKPKTLQRSYKQHTYVVEFVPRTKVWKWTVTVINKNVFSDEAPTQVKAFRAAERFIDKNCL